MIIGLEGVVEHLEPTILHLNVNGVIYEVNISLHVSGAIKDKRVRLHITQIIREDANLLFGFLRKEEKRVFDSLLKVNGVGPKVALAVCSTFSPEDFASIIASKDVKMLKKVPGVGPKAANRILVELADFVIGNEDLSLSNKEAILALESLGFKKKEILDALRGEEGDTAMLVKKALKKLQRL